VNQPPTAAITSPSANVTIAGGQSVSFSGTGTDSDGVISAYTWSFPGATPSSSTQASPGSVTYSTAGIFVASLTVTDDGGLVSPAATRTVVVTGGDFDVAATPASAIIARDGGATYSVAVTAGPGFAGTTTLSVSGLPKQATAKFAPSSVVNSGTSTLTVDTKKQVARGTYTLTITGASGGRTHSATVTMVVQ
jgi:hypothetical protein